MLPELGIDTSTRLMLVAAPDSVLAEAGRLTPRPSFAPGIMTAEPADMVVWWPEADSFTDAAVARLKWFLEMGKGSAWIILDPREDAPAADEVGRTLLAQGLRALEQRSVAEELAIRVELQLP